MTSALGKGTEKPVVRERGIELSAAEVASFRRKLMHWYEVNARKLPWRGVNDPYRTWVSEIMLQQTRVAAVIVHYHELVRRFPTIVSLSLAPEATVLAAECCYGAELYDPALGLGQMGMCNTYLARKAYAYFGSTNSSLYASL